MKSLRKAALLFYNGFQIRAFKIIFSKNIYNGRTSAIISLTEYC